jgi:hypothetical protein
MSRLASGFSASAGAAMAPRRSHLTARRRHRRVVRRLRRLAVVGLELDDAGQRRLVLREQLVDARRGRAVLPQQLQDSGFMSCRHCQRRARSMAQHRRGGLDCQLMCKRNTTLASHASGAKGLEGSKQMVTVRPFFLGVARRPVVSVQSSGWVREGWRQNPALAREFP